MLGMGNFLATPLWLHAQKRLRDKGPIPQATLGAQDCLALLGYEVREQTEAAAAHSQTHLDLQVVGRGRVGAGAL